MCWLFKPVEKRLRGSASRPPITPKVVHTLKLSYLTSPIPPDNQTRRARNYDPKIAIPSTQRLPQHQLLVPPLNDHICDDLDGDG